MPPSPAMRCSPRRELRAEHHKRGRSLESGILFQEKDDDLALFNEVQKREKDNFLLQSNDDFEDAFSSKLRYLSDPKLGISIPVRGESSDLLNADGEKNDYDWLLTPPDTPLFPSLDDETPPVNLVRRGRPQSQPISISRSSTMDKSCRSSRGSASPNRLSPSPRSGNSMLQSRGRPSSAPLSSPTPCLQHATSSTRVSPPSKPSTPVPRSSTPTPRRVSTGSSGNVSSSQPRGTSPVKTNRGNSMSPKIRAWQSNFSGFSSEVPPNLRTSMAERPVSYVRGSSPVSRNGRGSSPASRNGKDSSLRSGRQSMSPTASRSISSSHSHDRERLSTRSKGSVASSGDDDVDSLPSATVTGSDHLVSRNTVTFTNKRKDNRKGPQNMFRPLLSSVPSSTFYAGKTSAAHRAMISRNSSVTTSSNASSDQGTNAALDTEGSDLNHEDVTSGFVRLPDHDIQDEIFGFDKVDSLKEDDKLEIHKRLPRRLCGKSNGEFTVKCKLDDSGDFSRDSNVAIPTNFENLNLKADACDVEDMVLCSKCGLPYHATAPIEGDLKLCPDCTSNIALTILMAASAIVPSENSPKVSARNALEHESDGLDPMMAAPEPQEVVGMGTIKKSENQKFVDESQNSNGHLNWPSLPKDPLEPAFVDEVESRLAKEQVSGQRPVSSGNEPAGSVEKQHFSEHLHALSSVSGGAGISLLLKRSGSVKGPIVQSRSFTAITVPHDDLSYVRDSTNSMKSSLGHGGGSASSSVDLSYARQTETRVQRQLSGRKSDIENSKHEISAEYQQTGLFVPVKSSHNMEACDLPTGAQNQSLLLSSVIKKDVMEGRCVSHDEELLRSENAEVDELCASFESSENCSSTTPNLSSHASNVHSGDISVTSFSNSQDSVSNGSGGKLISYSSKIFDAQTSAVTMESAPVNEEGLQNSLADRVVTTEISTPGSLDKIPEIEIENGRVGSPGLQSDLSSPNSKTSIDDLCDPYLTMESDKRTYALIAECDTSDHTRTILEESTVLVEGQGGSKPRSLTLEEATDTILFCSSIVQGLAYEAATIAMDKEISVPLEGSRPTVTILGKSTPDRKHLHSRMPRKRTFKTQRAKHKQVETDAKPTPDNEDNEKSDGAISTTRIVGAPNKIDDSIKPPKLESKCNCTIM